MLLSTRENQSLNDDEHSSLLNWSNCFRHSVMVFSAIKIVFPAFYFQFWGTGKCHRVQDLASREGVVGFRYLPLQDNPSFSVQNAPTHCRDAGLSQAFRVLAFFNTTVPVFLANTWSHTILL
ncbi:hypothetical protein TNCT_484721 [Trichonephila clavata]|uniref:Uncharacterized protein n=1 Tax=Trichonephila clavata TaxID=2740835 RepID=A0A8X6LL30_TRICU|nr:hypothetical protein TNCT_484721 [Trichonephila clavata]